MAEIICVNREINALMCPCSNRDCANWALCCQCVAAHRESGSLTACMQTARSDDTLSLQGSLDCEQRESTLEVCACSYEPCIRRGVCCECLRNHWNAQGTGRPACFR